MTTFPHRCAAALTHPLTVAALFTLLFNDLVLKSLWPGWVTGKLSDLAWVVFAPPLIAFALCRLTRGNLLAERGVFAVAYVGLPLLYAAFNTFEPLHEWIISGLLFLSGGAVGSPWDPTDSIVIPLGFALTLWVWRQSGARPANLRTRLSLYVAVIAALASLASTGREPTSTEWYVGVTKGGSVTFEGPEYDYYRSDDGGLTWLRSGSRSDVTHGGQSVETPRGTYATREFGVTLAAPGAPLTTVYSTDYLQESSYKWAQRYRSRNFRYEIIVPGFDDPERLLATGPVNIVYHEGSANVIVSLGLEGVLVGTPDGTWNRVAVGDFAPTGFSFLAKGGLLFSGRFWPAAFALALSMLAIALVFSEFAANPSAARQAWLAIAALLFASLLGAIYAVTFAAGIALLVVGGPILLLVAALGTSRVSTGRQLTTIFFAGAGAVLAFFSLPPLVEVVLFPETPTPFLLFFSVKGFDSLVVALGLASSILAVMLYLPPRSQLKAFNLAFAVMLACIIGPLLLWLAGGITLPLATTALVLLLIATALLFRWHLLRQATSRDLQPSPPLPAPSKRAPSERSRLGVFAVALAATLFYIVLFLVIRYYWGVDFAFFAAAAAFLLFVTAYLVSWLLRR